MGNRDKDKQPDSKSKDSKQICCWRKCTWSFGNPAEIFMFSWYRACNNSTSSMTASKVLDTKICLIVLDLKVIIKILRSSAYVRLS